MRSHLRLESVFHGPNPFASRPVVTVHVSEGLQRMVSLPRAVQQLREIWPTWLEDEPPATEDELTRAAACAAAWALGALTEWRGYLHARGAAPRNDGAVAWVEFHHPDVSRFALSLAFHTLIEAGRDGFSRAAIEPDLRRLEQLCRRHHPDYQARILMEGAAARDIPVLPYVPGSKYWQYGWGSHARVFFESASNADGAVGNMIQRSKLQSKAAFHALGIPTPRHVAIDEPGELELAAKAVGWPCVVKPIELGGGKGVTANIRSLPALRVAFEAARRYSNGPIMVEALIPGDDHRLMVVGGRLIAAIRREPSCVVGDGKRTVRELVAALNANRSSNMVRSRYLRPIGLDDTLVRHLATQNATIDTIPAAGQKLTLRSNANLSTGGICIDVTERVHPEIRGLAEHLATTLKIETAGLDYITTDIERAPGENGGGFIEVNTTPGVDAAIAAGWETRTVASLVLGDKPGRIPLVLVLVPGRAEGEALLERLARATSTDTGWAWGERVVIGTLTLRVDTATPWAAVSCMLRHRSVNAAVIVCTAEQIARDGLPVDKADRALICGAPLENDWQIVLERSVGAVELLPDWTALDGDTAIAAKLGLPARSPSG